MTAKKMMIVVGYDNGLTTQDINTIRNIKKWDKNGKYGWRFFYYIPNIPAGCLIEREFVNLEQTYRDKAKVALHHLSKTLDIPLLAYGDLIRYHEMIESGSTAVIQLVKNKEEEYVILTSHPDKLKFDIFDQAMNWIKATKLWQQMSNKFIKPRTSSPVIIMTPQQFVEESQVKRLNRHKSPHENNHQEMANTHPFTKLWQEANRTTAILKIKDAAKPNSLRESNEKEANKEEALMNLTCKLQF